MTAFTASALIAGAFLAICAVGGALIYWLVRRLVRAFVAFVERCFDAADNIEREQAEWLGIQSGSDPRHIGEGR